MRISDPERAIAAFEQALMRSPNDAALASRIGQVRRLLPPPRLPLRRGHLIRLIRAQAPLQRPAGADDANDHARRTTDA